MRRLRLTRYSAIAFVTGFVLMAFELVAARLLAPTIGTSIYIWTSVIGVMIAALAAGYAAGGWVADRRTEPLDVVWLLLLASFAILSTLVQYHAALTVIIGLTADPRLQGVIAAVVLFMPASFIVGAVSPYLARLQTTSVDTTGRTVAGLSALNSLGGITGTFATGFIFFSLIGSAQTLSLLIATLVLSSWLIQSRAFFGLRLAGSLMAVGIGWLYCLPVATAHSSRPIDTATSHYEVANFYYRNQPIRGLLMGPGGIQSAIAPAEPNRLVFPYTQKIASLAAAAPAPQRILILGGGAFTLPEYLGRTYPRAAVDVVEIDPQLPTIARQYFDYQQQPRTTVYATDARAFLERPHQPYDLVIIDTYSDYWVPFALTTREFTERLAGTVTPTGVVLVNLIGSAQWGCRPYIGSINASYAHAFHQQAVFPAEDPDLNHFQNLILVYSNASLGWADAVPNRQTYLEGPIVPLTDNFAPVEPLLQQCMDAVRY
ncbi:MAG TPA: fused MFS/spermidine synthase [Candidatus Saccharimonadia bacterium]